MISANAIREAGPERGEGPGRPGPVFVRSSKPEKPRLVEVGIALPVPLWLRPREDISGRGDAKFRAVWGCVHQPRKDVRDPDLVGEAL